MNDEIQVLDTDTPIIENTEYTPYERINFENGTLVKPGIVDMQTGEFTMPEYSGKTPINATTLNHIESGIKNLENYVLNNSSGGSGGGSSDPVGTVRAFAGTIIPDDSLDCDGEQYSVTEYSDLYAIIGTAFNLPTDNDPTKFRTPNLKGRVIVGIGNFDTTHSFTLAKTGGEYEHQITIDEMPEHYHQGLTWSAENGQAINLNAGSGGISIYNSWNGADSTKPSPIYTGKAGESQSHNNMQPYLALRYIIKAVKTTPLMAEAENSLESDSTTNAPTIHAVNQIKHNNLITNESPAKCGYKVDGKDVYVVKVSFNAPTSTNNLIVNKEIDIPISKIKILPGTTGILSATNGENNIVFPDSGGAGGDNFARLTVNKASNGNANVSAIFGQPRSGYTVEVNVYFIYR